MLTIVIPTYWTRESSLPAKKDDRVFDHPTALDGDDTLTRTLESLTAVTGDFNVAIITATVSHEIDLQVEKRVEEIISPFKKRYRILQFSESDLDVVRRRMPELALSPEDVSLEGYSAIRNCQLLVPAIMGSDVIAAIDDDEIVEPDFADRALDFIGKKIGNLSADGVGGRYYYEWGDFRVKEPDYARKSTNVFDRKHALQNDSYTLFDSREGRVVETSIVLGGNMVFSRKLFSTVPFDPLVTRGEDIDYLINSRLMGFNWVLDKELKIYHYPPPCNPSHKLQEDIMRFIYEKRKIELASEYDGFNPIDINTLKPYPGEFFTETLIKDSLEALRKRENLTGEEAFYLSPDETIKAAEEKAARAGEFFEFSRRWKNIIEGLGSDAELKNYFSRKLNQTM